MNKHVELGYTDEWFSKKLEESESIEEVFKRQFEMEQETFEWLKESDKNNKHNKRKSDVKKNSDKKIYRCKGIRN